MSSDLVLEGIEQADARAKELFAGTGISVLTTGSGRLFSTLDHYLVMSQLSSFGTAFVTVFGVIFIVFRSFRFGILTIVPNLLPVVAVLGVMGYLGITLNIATVMVASVALGVVDDDTIHFINRYRREVASGSVDRRRDLDRHRPRGAGVLDHRDHQQLRLLRAAAVGVPADRVVRRAVVADHGGRVPRRGADPPRDDQAAAALVRRRRAARRRGAGLRRPRSVPGLSAFRAAGQAQSLSRPGGHVSVMTAEAPSRDTLELRARAFVEQKAELSPQFRVTASAFVEGLVRRHPEVTFRGAADAGSTVTTDAVLKAHDAFVEYTAGRFDLRVGLARVVWGRLDEVQPTDVVNPLDVSRFFFEGRSEARLPVALVRARVFLSDRASIEGVYVPVFRGGRFDQLDRPSSSFTPLTGPADGDRRRVPRDRLPHASAGDCRQRARGDRPERAGWRTPERHDWPGRLECVHLPAASSPSRCSSPGR